MVINLTIIAFIETNGNCLFALYILASERFHRPLCFRRVGETCNWCRTAVTQGASALKSWLRSDQKIVCGQVVSDPRNSRTHPLSLNNHGFLILGLFSKMSITLEGKYLDGN